MQDEIAARLTNALILQSTTGERVASALERLEKRLAVQPDSALHSPRVLFAQLVVVASVAALVASCTVYALGAP